MRSTAMRSAPATAFRFLLTCWVLWSTATPSQAIDDHLVLCEAALTPTEDEFLEIANPTESTVALDDYYLSDDEDYALLPGAFGAGPAPSIGSSDFIVRFPEGASIGPGEIQVIAFDGAAFAANFGFAPDYEIRGTDAGVPDMIATDLGSSAGLTNSGENAVLFFWDGAADLVADVDMVHLGTPSSTNDIGDKTGLAVDGPDAGTGTSTYLPDAVTMPQQAGDPGFELSTKRLLLETGNESTGGGNGITGDDETSEDIATTWDSSFGAPNPGICNALVVVPKVAEIFEIQGDGLSSPFAGFEVTTEDNIVTVVGVDGFFLQTPTSRDDFDDDTSNGIFVFTSDPPTVSVGDQIDVTGTVEEFFGLTEITFATISVDSTGNPLPAAIVFDDTVPSPDPEAPSCSIEFECYEGMLIEIPSGIVCGPNLTFVSDPIAEIQITAGSTRCLREPGVEFPGLGMPPIPTWDGNPEVFELDPDKLGLPSEIVPGGSTFSATGALGFEFSDYELWPSSFSFTEATIPDPVRSRADDEFSVGSLNLFRLFNDVDDPGTEDDGQVVTTMEYQTRLTKFSRYIREVLDSPDVLALQEAESLAVLNDLAAQILADDASVAYSAELVEGNDVGGIDVGYLVRDTVMIDAVTQLGAAEILDFDGSLLHDRPPLLLEATYLADSFPFAVMNLHQRSLSGIDDPDDGERVRAKRFEQAQSVAEKVQDFQIMNPTVPLAVVGDFNAFEFTDGYVDVTGHIAGDFDPTMSLVSGPDLVDPNLDVRVLHLPSEERYSFIFDGNAQVLDHSLTSLAAAPYVRDLVYGRGNADAARILLDDDSTPLRASDHDGFVQFFSTVPALFTDDFESGDISAWASSTEP